MPPFRQRAHALVDVLADYLEAAERGEGPAIPYRDPDEAFAYWRAFDGGTDEALAAVLAQSTNVHHPGYVGHQVAVPHADAILASWVSDVLNNGSAVYEMGMAGNAIERVVGEELGAAFGLRAGAGAIFTSGGSLANLTALLAARAARAPSAPAESLCVLVSDQAHYCIERAAHIMGWGVGGVVSLRTGRDYRVLAEALPEALAEAARRGRTPIAVVGMACSTSTGTYDDLRQLADFAEANDLWFHVDGAHGAAARFAPEEAHRVAGIERADSVTLDAHKMMRAPALTTALLFARAGDSYRTFDSRADYLWGGEATGEWYHSGQRTVECTKLLMGLRVLALLRGEGLAGIGRYVASRCALARAFAAELRGRPGWEVALAPESNIVCFRQNPPHLAEPGALDAHNAALRERYLRDGRWYVVSTRLRGVYWLRVTLMNPDTTLEHLGAMLGFAERALTHP